MTQQRLSFLGLPIDTGTSIAELCNLLVQTGECRLVTFVNAAAWALAAQKPDYVAQLEKMTVIQPSGCDVAFAATRLLGQETSSVYFETHSLVAPFFKTAIEQKKTLMLVGGQPAIDERVHDKLNTHYPELNIISSVNGYGDITPKIVRVMEKNPDCVLVDLPTPRAETFLLALKDAGFKGLAIACDGFFDETLRDEEFYPAWAKKHRLYFVYRLLAAPKTLLSNFLKAYPAFIIPAVKAFYQLYADKYLPKQN